MICACIDVLCLLTVLLLLRLNLILDSDVSVNTAQNNWRQTYEVVVLPILLFQYG